MPRVPEGFVDECLDRGVVVVPGEAFGEHGAATLGSVRDRRKRAPRGDVMADAYEGGEVGEVAAR